MKTFIYTHSHEDKGRLVEKATMDRPMPPLKSELNWAQKYIHHIIEWNKYKDHIASRTEYQTIGFMKQDEGEMGEDRFRLQHQVMSASARDFVNCGKEYYEGWSENNRRIIAIPVERKEQVKEKDHLLLCPFCGGQPEWVHLVQDKIQFYWNRRAKPPTEERMFTLNEVEILIADFAKQYRSAKNPDLMNDVAEFLQERNITTL